MMACRFLRASRVTLETTIKSKELKVIWHKKVTLAERVKRDPKVSRVIGEQQGDLAS